MDVLVVRHAKALKRHEAQTMGMLDRDRPLTKSGRARMKRVARRVLRCAPEISLLVTSPFRRAVETGSLLQARHADVEVVQSEALLPDADPEALVRLLAEHQARAAVGVVGHEPQLSRWVSYCLTGDARPILELRKAGACLLRFEDGVAPLRARLIWLLTSATLRQR